MDEGIGGNGPEGFGAQSMTARLRRVQLVRPGALQPEPMRAAAWTAAEQHAAQAQFDGLREILARHDVEIVESAVSPDDNPDAVYAFDPILVTGAGVVVLNMAKPNRRAEPEARAAELGALGIPVLGRIEPPGTMDGGDVLWIGPTEVAVGLGWRTNLDAVGQLQTMLAPLGVDVTGYDLPNYRGPGHCLHLMSLISLCSPTLAVIDEAMLPVRLVQRLDALGVERVAAPPEELETLAVNVLCLGDGAVVGLSGNPVTAARLQAAGLQVELLDAPDLCLAGSGGPTCLVRPLWRA